MKMATVGPAIRSPLKSVLQPWQLLLLILAGWMNHQEQDVIESLHTENRVHRKKLGKKCTLLDDDHRRCLAMKGKILSGKCSNR